MNYDILMTRDGEGENKLSLFSGNRDIGGGHGKSINAGTQSVG